MLAAILKSMRPAQWVKNLFVLAPLFFSGSLFMPGRIAAAILTFAAFSALASAAYLANDIADRERDRSHPEKRRRPIASGALPVGTAIVVAAVLATTAILVTLAIHPQVTIVLAAYALLNAAYSSGLKHVVIVDVFCIAIGFVLRVVAGSLAIAITPTAWIVVATFLLALFLALAKRRNELQMLGDDSSGHRPVLDEYTTPLVDELISVVTPATLLTYLLYTLDPEVMHRLGSDHLYASTVFVVFGIFRYLFLVHRMELGGSPTDIVLKDVPLIVAIAGWVVTLTALVYF